MLWRKIQYDLEKTPVWFAVYCRCEFVAFREDLGLQSHIIIIFRNRACVLTTEQSRIVEHTRPDFGGKHGMVWRKNRYEMQFGEKIGTFGEKSGIPEKNSVSIPSVAVASK